MPLATRALGSFSLAGGPVAVAGGPTSVVLYRQTDAFIVSPCATNVGVVANASDASVVPQQSDAAVVPQSTDVDVYL